MPRIVGVDVPNDKRMAIALTYIQGIGRTTSEKILKEVGIDPSKRAGELTGEEITKIAGYIDNKLIIEGELRRQVSANIKRLMEIRSYRGLRHKRGLPVRGQRTRTNARTRKGKKKTVARKASVKELR
jgi:small subunit ribosomal protein S13